jgi:hypothetical protein
MTESMSIKRVCIYSTSFTVFIYTLGFAMRCFYYTKSFTCIKRASRIKIAQLAPFIETTFF